MAEAKPGPQGPRAADQSGGAPPPTYQSRDLFQGGKVVLIVHEGREYWLRITNAGKLILTA